MNSMLVREAKVISVPQEEFYKYEGTVEEACNDVSPGEGWAIAGFIPKPFFETIDIIYVRNAPKDFD